MRTLHKYLTGQVLAALLLMGRHVSLWLVLKAGGLASAVRGNGSTRT